MHKTREWLGKWIGSGISIEERLAPIFKKDFDAEKEIRNATAYICGLGLFEMKVNGTLPDDTFLNPAHTQYSKTVLYRTFDITSLLKSGKNEITVELGNSFFNETTDIWHWDAASWRSSPKLIADIVIEYTDGSSETIATDEDWLVTLDGPITANSIYYGETYDARRKEFSWQKACLADAPEGKLKEQYMPPIRRINTFAPKKIQRLDDGAFVITAPEMVTGWAKIRIDAPEGTEVYITYNERLTDDGHVRKIGKGEGRDGNWFPNGYIQQDCFISNGEAFEYEPKFSYKGFKYIQVEGVENLCSEDIEIYRTANDVEIISEFTCSDPNINRLHKIAVNTMLNNFQGKPTDTPVWEKNGWLGDANMALDMMMFNFDMSTFLPSFIDVMKDCFDEYGSVPVIAPSVNWSIENSPVWNSIFVFGVLKLVRHCGMYDYAEEIYPTLKEYAIKNIIEIKEKGWVWNTKGLADWVAPAGDVDLDVICNTSEGAEICCTAFVFEMLWTIQDIANLFEKYSDDSDEYFEVLKVIADEFSKKFYNKDKKIYETTFWEPMGKRTEYRQTSNLLPLAFCLASKSEAEEVAKNLAEDVIRKDYHLDTGCVGTKFILPVLCDYGYTDVAYKVLTQTTYPSWGSWLESDTDSAWESWEPLTRSLNHYFLATYDEFFFTHLAGIKFVDNGYSRVRIEPVLKFGLDFVKTKIKTPKGILRIEWTKSEGGYEIEAEIPEGTTAHINLLDKINATCFGGIYKFTIQD